MQVMDAYIYWISKDVPDLYPILTRTMTDICNGTSGPTLTRVSTDWLFSNNKAIEFPQVNLDQYRAFVGVYFQRGNHWTIIVSTYNSWKFSCWIFKPCLWIMWCLYQCCCSLEACLAKLRGHYLLWPFWRGPSRVADGCEELEVVNQLRSFVFMFLFCLLLCCIFASAVCSLNIHRFVLD